MLPYPIISTQVHVIKPTASMTIDLCKFFELHYHLILGQTKAVLQSTEAVLSHAIIELAEQLPRLETCVS